MPFEITSGIKRKPIKAVIYGTEGVGKSTFASQFPNPIFIDAEDGTSSIDVARYPRPTTYQMLIAEIQEFLINPRGYKTLVIDSIDWVEAQAIRMICATFNVNGIEDIGWSKGYTYLNEEIGKLLNLLTEVNERGINVVLIAHMVIRTITKPEETGSYDRYELKLKQAKNGNNCQLVKEWADLLLFCNFKEFIVTDSKTNKSKATGGKERIMYTEHAATWDAKNRFGLPGELPLSFKSIEHLFADIPAPTTSTAPVPTQTITQQVQQPKQQPPAPQNQAPVQAEKPIVEQQVTKMQQAPVVPQKEPTLDITSIYQPTLYTADEEAQINAMPKALGDLMRSEMVHPSEIQEAVGKKGYFTQDTPITNYPKDFVEGCLLAAWPQVFELIKKERELPF